MKRIFLLCAVICVGVVCSLEAEESRVKGLFHSFMRKYNRHYESKDQFQLKYQNFKHNLKFVEEHNLRTDTTFTVAINQFGDWSREEYLNYLTFVPNSFGTNIQEPSDNHSMELAIPNAWDWREHGAVTPIKNQGQCGSSPYFSAVVSIEACHFITTGTLVGLSEQQIIDCTENEGNQGCNGGYMAESFAGIMLEGGIDSETCYPYKAEDENCTFIQTTPCCASMIQSYFNVTSGDEIAMKAAVYKVPVATAIDASQESFEFYSGGVYSDPGCTSQEIGHGIAVVGYGHNSTVNMDYWILKNSWGTSWGVEGWMYLARNDNNMCGIATYPSYTVGCPNCKA